MPILLGLLASVGIGVGDYFGRYCTRRSNATTTVIAALLGGIVTVLAATLFVPSAASVRAIGLGAVSGLLVGFALMLLYTGMAVSSTAVVSPIVALFVAVVPLLWDVVVGGAALSTVTIAGITLAIGGIVLTTVSPDIEGRIGLGIGYAVGSGLLFGIGWTVVGETSIESGVWPAVGQRVAAWLTLLAYGGLMSVPLVLPRPLRGWGALTGIAGAAGAALFILGAQRGDLGPVAVTSSLFPAVTAILAFLFDDDVLRWWQGIGIAVVIAGVALIATG